MATSSVASVAASVDVLSASERETVVHALGLARASALRAAKATTNAVIAAELNSEVARIESLVSKFR